MFGLGGLVTILLVLLFCIVPCGVLDRWLILLRLYVLFAVDVCVNLGMLLFLLFVFVCLFWCGCVGFVDLLVWG